MLLTSGQISVAISSSIVFAFTTLLFLSGYVLQQQTVHSLQAALHPEIIFPPVPITNPALSKHFGTPLGHNFYDRFLAASRPKGGWTKVAYVQLVRENVHVCNAAMLFRELERGGSMAQRVLMYPREWDDAAAETKGTETGKRSRRRRRNQKKLETSQRLLRKAAKEFKVLLLPIASTPQTTAATTGALTAEERHPLTNLLSLLHYNRVLFLPPSGLVLDSTPLDLLFTLPMEKPWLGLSAPSGQSAQPAVLLLEPSKQTYGDMVSSLPEGAYRDAEFLQRVPVTPAGADGEDTMALLAQTSGLENVDAQFNATGFLDRTAYVQLEDPTILGPEFDIPRQDFVRAMPSGRQARKAWEDVYKKYRDLRMEVCGLDLEPPPTVRGGEKEDSMNVKDLR